MPNSVAQYVFEIISLICITVTLIPQVILNYRLQNTKGLSTTSVILWILSGEVSAVYLIWTDQLMIISVADSLFVGFAVLIGCQIIYYTKGGRGISTTESKSVPARIKRYLVFSRNFAIFSSACIVNGLGVYYLFELSKSYGWIPKLLGAVVPVIVDTVSFIPQIRLIFKKKSASGYSLLFILTEVTGTLCGIVSVCLQEELDVTPLISFSSIVTFQTIILVLKLCVFRSEKRKRKIWPFQSNNNFAEKVSSKAVDGENQKWQSKGLLYVRPQTGTHLTMNTDNRESTQQSPIHNETATDEAPFSVNGQLKNFFEKEMQAYHVEMGTSDESIVRMFAKQMQNEDAFYIADVSHCAKQYMRWTHYLPRVTAFYAVKTNPNSFIIRVIGNMGGGFDCASIEELNTVLSIFPDLDCSTRIIYANPCKQISHIVYFRERGVHMTVADNDVELIKIKEHWPDAKVLIRLKTNDNQSVIALSSKYGATERVAIQLFQLAKSINLVIVGCAFHVGSGCYDPAVFTKSIELAKRLFEVAKRPEYDFKLTLLNIGGGYPGTNEDGKPSFLTMAKTINEAINEFFPESEGVKCIAEPGRYFAAACMTLVTSVIGCRRNNKDYVNKIPKQGEQDLSDTTTIDNAEYIYYINDGIYGSLSNIIFEEATYIVTCFHKNDEPPALSAEELHTCAVFGPTCDSSDRLSASVRLPLLSVGDYIYIRDVGAYSNSIATSFNGFKTSKYFYIYRD